MGDISRAKTTAHREITLGPGHRLVSRGCSVVVIEGPAPASIPETTTGVTARRRVPRDAEPDSRALTPGLILAGDRDTSQTASREDMVNSRPASQAGPPGDKNGPALEGAHARKDIAHCCRPSRNVIRPMLNLPAAQVRQLSSGRSASMTGQDWRASTQEAHSDSARRSGGLDRGGMTK